MTAPALEVSALRAYYRTSAFGIRREVRAVDDIDLRVEAGEIYGLAGESSSGKTTLIKTIANAIQPPLQVLAGSVVFNLRDRRVNIHGVTPRGLSAIRWKHLSYIMQGSMNVLNPVRRVRYSFVDFAFRHIGQPMPAFLDTVRDHLQRLHLAPDILDAFPHQLSGGMRQRVTIALATVCRPEFIIADEPTTALDVVVQKGVLAMIHEIQRELGSSILFVTHDMSVHANSPIAWASCMPAALSRKAAPPTSSARPSIPIPPISSPACRDWAILRPSRASKVRRPTSPTRRRAAAFTRAVRAPPISAD